MANLNRILRDIEKKHGRAVARAFADAIGDIVNTAQLGRITAALRNNDIQRAIDILNIDNAVFSRMSQELVAAYNAAATATIGAIPWRAPDNSTLKIRWDIANPRATQWAADLSSNKITVLSEQLKQSARDVIAEAVSKGTGPRQTALELVGRIGPNGKRTGGFIGLSNPQVTWVQNMTNRLSSGDPSELRKVLTMTRRDRRLDGIVNRAIESGKPVSAKDIEKITGRYKVRLLKSRGDTIARTETLNAVASARFDAAKEGASKSGVPDWAITKKWRHGGGGLAPRGDHIAMSGVKAQGLNTPFRLPDGTQMQHPHDGSLGAGAKHLANCTCYYDITIDYAALYRGG